MSDCSVTETDPTTGVSYTAYPSVDVVGGEPNLIWMIIPGKAQWLKQFFDVEMSVTNLAPAGFSLDSGTATLDLPTGLSLATLDAGITPETLKQSVTSIPGGTTKTVDWLIRGDTEGLYSLSATYNASLSPVGAPVQFTAETPSDSIHIWGATALSMAFTVDDYAFKGDPYHIQMAMTDVADIPVYNLTFGLTPLESPTRTYIFQPDQPAPKTISELDPGQTVTESFIVVPDFSGMLSETYSYVSAIATSKANISMAGGSAIPWTITTQTAPTTYPAISAKIESNGIHVSWRAVAGAKEYELFTSPAYGTDFPAKPELTVSGSTTSAILHQSSYALIAVSTVFHGASGNPYNMLEHPLLAGPLLPTRTPLSPTVTKVVPASTKATLTWTAPPANGVTVLGYQVFCYQNGVPLAPVTFASTAKTETVTHLVNGDSYVFTVAAYGNAGDGVPSNPTASYVVGGA